MQNLGGSKKDPNSVKPIWSFTDVTSVERISKLCLVWSKRNQNERSRLDRIAYLRTIYFFNKNKIKYGNVSYQKKLLFVSGITDKRNLTGLCLIREWPCISCLNALSSNYKLLWRISEVKPLSSRHWTKMNNVLWKNFDQDQFQWYGRHGRVLGNRYQNGFNALMCCPWIHK